jgi:hypothetical protein
MQKVVQNLVNQEITPEPINEPSSPIKMGNSWLVERLLIYEKRFFAMELVG